MENRTIKKSFRFTQSEWLEIEHKCDISGLTPSQYFQKIATTGRVAKRDCLKEKQLYLGQIGMVGNNINQIARRLNSGDKIDIWMLQLLLKVEQKLNEVWLL